MGANYHLKTLLSYDKYIVYFSGGKDCTAAFLWLLDSGVPTGKIELWHHDIDGDGSLFMDWEITRDYCRAFAQAFNVPIYFSGKVGGFKRELLRENSKTAAIYFEDEKHNIHYVGGTNGKNNTRRKFPQISPDLSVRWCSPYLKIDVGAAALRNQVRFNGLRTLTISGERGEESSARAKYKTLEPDRADLRGGKLFSRYVDRCRPLIDWPEKMVWAIIEKHKIRVHPAYYLGWSRVSCKFCIFGNADQFASAYYLSPSQGDEIIALEKEFGYTIKRDINLKDYINNGKPYDSITKDLEALATSYIYTETIFTDNWILPAGAYKEGCGPS